MSELYLVPEQMQLIWFTGADAVRFLNDLISQEIASLQTGSVVRSFLLEPRGKLDHLLWVLRDDEAVALVASAGRGEDLRAKLARYRIRVAVEIGDPEECWLVLGAMGVLPGNWERTDHGLLASLPWSGPDLTLGTGDRPEAKMMSAGEWDRVRIEALEPRFGVDVDESTIPQESGLVPEAVDFTKGCYLGQELVARIDSRGHVNRHLRLLAFEDDPPDVGAEILEGARVVGTVTSVAGNLGLGMVRREVPPGARVQVGDEPALVLR